MMVNRLASLLSVYVVLLSAAIVFGAPQGWILWGAVPALVLWFVLLFLMSRETKR
jgi:hypothetical protein